MLESKKIELRRSEVRQQLAVLAGKTEPTADELRSMETLNTEYGTLETRYRAALVGEDTERRDAGKDLETRDGKEWDKQVGAFEVRQVALNLDEGAPLSGPTAEVVQELRSRGGFRGTPIPWAALRLEKRVGETVGGSDVPEPKQTRDIIDQLFPRSIAAAMGGDIITIDHGTLEFPLTTDGCTVGWQATELGAVGAASQFQTAQRVLKPDHTLGTQMILSRRSLKQVGAGLEMAVRRDMNFAIAAEMDRVAFNGSGADGQPLGIITGASTYGINSENLDGGDAWATYRSAVKRFMEANAVASPAGVRLAILPATWDALDDALFDTGSGVTELDRMLKFLNPVISNQLDEGQALLTCSTNGVPPFAVGLYGAVDVVRDPYTKAASGQLVLTALATMDISAMRAAQIEVLEQAGGG